MIVRRTASLLLMIALAGSAAVPSPASSDAQSSRVSTLTANIEARRDRGEFEACAAAAVGGPMVCVGCQSNSIFEVASVSKTFTALIAARLAAQGKLDLASPITKYLPEHILAKKGTSITVRDLATHTSGLTDDWMAKAKIYGRGPFPFARDADYFNRLLSVEPVNPRGKVCRYACTNFILLGLIVERASGLDLAMAAQAYVFGPLKMRDTRWRHPVDLHRTVTTYTHGPRPPGMPGDENARGVSRAIGNAGVFTTLADLLKYADDLLNRRTFEPDAYDLLFTCAIEEGRRRRSFGWDMSSGTNPPGWSAAAVNHSGYTGSYLAIDPRTRQAVVVLTNLKLDDKPGRAASFEFRRKLCADLTLKESKFE